MKDLKKQADDIDLMIERMDEQVKQLTKANRDELEQIEVRSLTPSIVRVLRDHSGITLCVIS